MAPPDPAAGAATVTAAPAAGPLDGAAVRADFPIFAREVRGRRLVYLDSASTSQKPEAVIAAVDGFYRRHNANVHRGVYRLSEEATDRYEDARATVAAFIGAADAREVVFTRGTTEAINLVAAAWGDTHLGPGDAVVLTEMEHHANLVPWQLAAARRGAELRFIPLGDDGHLDLGALDRVIDRSVKLVAFTHVSNVLGTVNPVAALVAAARAVGAQTLLDAAQSVPHLPVDVGALGVDFAAFSGHKACGPTGIGVLWGRYAVLADLPPWQGGGDMIRRVTLRASTFEDPPGRFEAGTPPIAGAVGLAAAVRYLSALGMDRVRDHTHGLAALAVRRLADVPGVTVHGPRGARGGAVPFTLAGAHPHDLATVLDSAGVAVRAGHHCAMPLHDRLGLPATARASVYVYNTADDIEALVEALHLARGVLGCP